MDMEGKKRIDLESQLEETRRELEYYKRLSKESGDRRLRETEELSRLIVKLKSTEKEVAERNDRLAEANDALSLEINEHKQTQVELRKSEETYRSIISESSVGIAVYDASGQCTAANDAFAGFAGLEKALVLLQNFNDAPFWKKTGLLEKARLALKGNRTIRHEVKNESTAGRPVVLDCHLIPFLPGGLLLMANDVSEKKRFEEQLFESQKMEAIATLAGGIAHDFNNALFTITGHLDLLKIEFSSQPELGKSLNPMKAAANRMAELTSQLLAYAHGGKYQPQAVSMSDFVKNTLPIIKPMIHPDIRLEVNLANDIPSVMADVTQMQMVLSAVISNASEAISGKGTVRVIVRDEQVKDTAVEFPEDLKPGHYVLLSVEDNGQGMTEETRKRIFEPFFSTKLQGRGLGMASVHGIVKNHDGWIFVNSQVGIGTTVRIFFPPYSQ